MSNTAFLQLTIVLVSIDARMSALASSLLQNLSNVIPRLYAVFEALEVSFLVKVDCILVFKRRSILASHAVAAPTIHACQGVFDHASANFL